MFMCMYVFVVRLYDWLKIRLSAFLLTFLHAGMISVFLYFCISVFLDYVPELESWGRHLRSFLSFPYIQGRRGVVQKAVNWVPGETRYRGRREVYGIN